MDQGEVNYMNMSESDGVSIAVLKELDHILIYTVIIILLFSVLGMGTNIINLVVFTKMGVHETTTISMLALAVSDFLCCVLSLLAYMCYLPAFRDLPNLPFRPTEVSSETALSVRPYLTRTGALITAFITLERCLCVVVPMKVKNIITVPVTRISMVAIYVITVLPYIAHVFQTKLDWKFYPLLNRTLIGRVHLENPLVYVVMKVTTFICGFLYLLSASAIIFFCTLFLVITLVRSSKRREAMTKQTQIPLGKAVDLRVTRSRKEIRLIKMVVAIAILFIICHIPGMIVIFISAVTPEYLQTDRYSPSTTLMKSFLFAFEVISNSTNFFVYYAIGSRFKVVFRQAFGFKGVINRYGGSTSTLLAPAKRALYASCGSYSTGVKLQLACVAQPS
ncbi:chemosensory receptor a [Plakobranchus ocellatus]|uniref:Chemosensory receptor a n=1 Tax=Plakobranchus ocellatus TaxID=259542 RepID=A0AAV4AC98_9GAST|nr:chemosensory receptor a [Plakobranchus ocellatus]